MDYIDFGYRCVQHERWVDAGEGHEVSNLGRVRRNGKPKSLFTSDRGYVYVEISDRKIRLHRLVVEKFIGPIPPGCVVNHKDCDKTNNALSNLEVLTHQENMEHAKLHKRFKGGQSNKKRAVKDADREEIIALRIAGKSNAEISALTGRCRSLVQKVTAAWRARVSESVHQPTEAF